MDRPELRNVNLTDPEWERKERKNRYMREYRKKHPEYVALAVKKLRDKRTEERHAIIKYYGGKCACCGERRMEFLHVDRESLPEEAKKLMDVVKWVVKNDFPDGIVIKCYNCRYAEKYYGCCPHEKEKG